MIFINTLYYIIALFAGIPMVLDICLGYHNRYILIKEASQKGLDLNELKAIIGKAPPGIPGLARTMMSLTVILILGLAVICILMDPNFSGSKDQTLQLVNNILSMLAGLLAAITGFYFGGKATEDKSKAGDK